MDGIENAGWHKDDQALNDPDRVLRITAAAILLASFPRQGLSGEWSKDSENLALCAAMELMDRDAEMMARAKGKANG